MAVRLLGEPVMVIVAGGTTLVQAVFGVLIAFGYHVTVEQQVAVTTLCGIIFGLITRAQVTPTATLPPGVAGQIADAKAARDAGPIVPPKP